MRADSMAGWNRADAALEGWREGNVVRRHSDLGRIAVGSPQPLARPDNPSAGFYARRHVFISGQPRSAAVYCASSAPYQLFVNGTLTLSDTGKVRDAAKVDSAPGITSLLKSGENVIAMSTRPVDSAVCMIAVAVTALVDTTRKVDTHAPALVLARSDGQTRRVESADMVAAAVKADAPKRRSDSDAPRQQAQPAPSQSPEPVTAQSPSAAQPGPPAAAGAPRAGTRVPATRLVLNLKVKHAEGSLKRINRRIAEEQLAIQRLKTVLGGSSAR
jgi:hypothetical protein